MTTLAPYNTMWALDRFSNHSTPQPSPSPSRPFSPAPRRSNLGPSRPPLSARDSGLSNPARSISRTSVSRSAKPAPESKQERQIAPPPPDVEDPVAALNRLLKESGVEIKDDTDVSGYLSLSPPSIDHNVDFNGVSLQAFADSNASAQAKEYPNVLHNSQTTVEEFENENSRFEELHKSITGCDNVLQSVEKYMSTFQSDLAAVSAEIETLQSKSTFLNQRLEKRETVEKQISPVVERVLLSPVLIKKIIEGTVDENWARCLDELQQRSSALESAKDLESVKALQDLKPLLNDLSSKAVERIRDYFAGQIRALRSPNINAQIIQQQAFLRLQPLYAFLAIKEPKLAEDLMQAYSNTMRWYYHSHFVRYHASLSKLKLFMADKQNVLGEDPSVAAKAKTSTNLTPAIDNFSLARRIDILKSPSTTAMPSHAADDSKTAHHIETPYLAFNLALVDNASFEYTFLNNFFTTRRATSGTSLTSNLSTNHALVVKHFNFIFNPVLTIGSTFTKSLISESFDAFGVLIMVRMTQQFAFTLQRRKVPTLDSYINGTNMLLWPRFQLILDANCTSLRQLTSSLPNRASSAASAAGAIASLGGAASSAASAGSTAPHPITQRFANFARGIIDLSSEAADNEPVSNSLRRIRSEYEAFLRKLSGSLGSGERAKREGKRLLANNLSLILAVLGDAKGVLADETRTQFEEMRAEIA